MVKNFKWAKGVRDVEWMRANGTPVPDGKFNVDEETVYTLYYEPVEGLGRVYTFKPTAEEVKLPSYKVRLKDTKFGDKIRFGNMEWTVLDPISGKLIYSGVQNTLASETAVAWSSGSSVFDPTNATNIAYKLSNNFVMPVLLGDAKYVKMMDWDITNFDGTNKQTVRTNVGLLTAQEAIDLFGGDDRPLFDVNLLWDGWTLTNGSNPINTKMLMNVLDGGYTSIGATVTRPATPVIYVQNHAPVEILPLTTGLYGNFMIHHPKREQFTRLEWKTGQLTNANFGTGTAIPTNTGVFRSTTTNSYFTILYEVDGRINTYQIYVNKRTGGATSVNAMMTTLASIPVGERFFIDNVSFQKMNAAEAIMLPLEPVNIPFSTTGTNRLNMKEKGNIAQYLKDVYMPKAIRGGIALSTTRYANISPEGESSKLVELAYIMPQSDATYSTVTGYMLDNGIIPLPSWGGDTSSTAGKAKYRTRKQGGVYNTELRDVGENLSVLPTIGIDSTTMVEKAPKMTIVNSGQVHFNFPVTTISRRLAEGVVTAHEFAINPNIGIDAGNATDIDIPVKVGQIYTMGYKTAFGQFKAYTFSMTKEYALVAPRITSNNMIIKVKFENDNLPFVMNPRYAKGVRDASYFKDNGEVLLLGVEVPVNEVGDYTIYYEYYGTQYVQVINVIAEKIISKMGIDVLIDTSLEAEKPAEAVTYIEDTEGMSGVYWDGTTLSNKEAWSKVFPFNEIRPCVMKDGVVKYYLNPDDFTKKADGTDADIYGGDGDVMIEFPKIYWKGESVDTAHNRYYLSKEKEDASYVAYAHTFGGKEYNKLYVSAYMLSESGTKLVSVSGASPAQKTATDIRNGIKANFAKYEPYSFHTNTLIKMLYTMWFKDRDSQSALGMGYFNSSGIPLSSGLMNKMGMTCNGGTDMGNSVKLFGLEHMWGNGRLFLDGIRVKSDKYMYLFDTSKANPDNVNEYIKTLWVTTQVSGYIYKMQTFSMYPMLGSSTSLGAKNKHWCDDATYGGSMGTTDVFAISTAVNSTFPEMVGVYSIASISLSTTTLASRFIHFAD